MKVFRVIRFWCKKVFRKIKRWMMKPFRKKAKPGPEEKDTTEYGTGMKSQKHLLIRAARLIMELIDVFGWWEKWKKYTLTSMNTMLKLILIKHILIKTVLVKRIISGRNNYVYRKRT